MNPTMPETGAWIKNFPDVFLGLDSTGVIRYALGATNALFGADAEALRGTSWQAVIDRHADPAAREGLHYAWMAVAEDCVDPVHWPTHLPFVPGVAAWLAALEGDPAVRFTIHLSHCIEKKLNSLINEHLLDAATKLTLLTRQVYRGTNGPLTDQQVKSIGSMLHSAEYIQHLLEDISAEVLAPAVDAPLPHPLDRFLMFDEQDFLDKRLFTHRLSIRYSPVAETVYCAANLRGVIFRILSTLIAHITPQTAITLTPLVHTATIQVEIGFHSQEPELRLDQRLIPATLSEAARLRFMHPVERLVTSAQANLYAVNGQAWAEPSTGPEMTGKIVLILPRWRA